MSSDAEADFAGNANDPGRAQQAEARAKAAPRSTESTAAQTPKAGADEALRKAFANAGHHITFDDMTFVAGSKSARARPSEYALVRIPHSLSADQRTAMKKRLLEFRGDPYHTDVQFGTLPSKPRLP